MRLKQLTVYSWLGDGKYNGSIEFDGPSGEIKLTLDKRLSDKIIRACADELVEASKRAADAMTAEVITGALTPAIEDQTADSAA